MWQAGVTWQDSHVALGCHGTDRSRGMTSSRDRSVTWRFRDTWQIRHVSRNYRVTKCHLTIRVSRDQSVVWHWGVVWHMVTWHFRCHVTDRSHDTKSSQDRVSHDITFHHLTEVSHDRMCVTWDTPPIRDVFKLYLRLYLSINSIIVRLDTSFRHSI